jgi:hypothetical protein
VQAREVKEAIEIGEIDSKLATDTAGRKAALADEPACGGNADTERLADLGEREQPPAG